MESTNNILGKFNKKSIYLNHGKYGFYLTYDKKNYKIPEWFPAEKMDIDIAEKLIEYKKKMADLWPDDNSSTKKGKVNIKKNDSESSEEETKK